MLLVNYSTATRKVSKSFSGVTPFKCERDSVVGIAIRLWAGRPGVRIPTDARDFSLLQNVQTDSGAHLTFYSAGMGFICPGFICPG